MDTAEAPTSRDERDLLGVWSTTGSLRWVQTKIRTYTLKWVRFAPDSARGLTVTLDKIGLHALNWFDRRARG